MKDVLVPAMFITAQRQLWSENLRVAEGNPFTNLPLGFTVGCLVQGIDFSHFLSGPKITYWFTLLTVVSWKLNHGDLHCHTKRCSCCCCGKRDRINQCNLKKEKKKKTTWCRRHEYLIKKKHSVKSWLKNQTLMGAQCTSNIFVFRASGVAKATEESNITAPSICAVPPLNVLL